LAGISVAHLYNLRKQSRYRERRLHYTKTRPTPVNIGERRKPEPEGKPGYLRVPQISEAFLLPALEQILQQFPFEIRGFHSDNSSEYINRSVAQLLDKPLIEQTKSRPRRSNDNGLVETKNGSVIRKHMGYGHIGSAHSEAIFTLLPRALKPIREPAPAVCTGRCGD